MEEIAELVARLRLQDDTVAGLNAARDRLEKAADAAEDLEKALKDTGVATEQLDVKARSAGKSFDAVNRTISGTALTNSMAAKVTREHADAVEKLTVRYNQEGRSAAELAAGIARLDAVRDAGLQKAREAGARLEAQFGATAAAGNKLADSNKEAAYQAKMMAFQIQDVVASLGSSTPPLQVFLQQGGQIASIYGGAGNALKAIIGMLGGPWVLGFVAAAAAVGLLSARAATFQTEQRAISIALQAVGKDASLASSQMQEYVRQLERAGVARSDARSAVTQLARTPDLSVQMAGRVTGLAADFGAAAGIQTTEALKQLSQVATGTYADVTKLSDSMNLLDVSTRKTVASLFEQGKAGQAVDIVFKALEDRIKGMHENSMGPMDKALRDLSNSWTAFMDRIANSGPVIQALKVLAEAVAGLDDMAKRAAGGTTRPGDAQDDRIASLTMARDRVNARYLMLNQLREGNPARMEIPQLEQRLGEIDRQIAELRQGARVARGEPGALPGMGNPLPDSIGPAASVSGDNMATQWGRMEDLTESYKRQNEVLKASIPARVALEARMQAEADLRTNGLKDGAAEEYKRRKVAEAVAKEADARAQELAVLSREAQGLMGVALASEQGLAAMIQARAAAEAHEQASTKAGVAEEKLKQAIINRAAAQEADKGATNLLEINNRIDSLTRLTEAEKGGASASYWAALDEKIVDATRSLKAYAEATSDPGLRAILDTLIKKTEERMKTEAALNEQLALRKEMTQGSQELEMLKRQLELVGESASVRERELASLKAIQEIERKGGSRNSLNEDQKNYIEQRRQIADANSELRKHEALYQEIANSAQQAFDQVGQAIVSAFINGNGAAVNFGNVFKGVLSSILVQIAKLGVINPVLNAIGLGGSDRPSLFSAQGTASVSRFLDTGGLLGGSGLFSRAKNFLFGSQQTLGPGDTTFAPGLLSGTGIGDMLKGIGDFLPSMSDIGSMFGGFGIGSALGSLIAGDRRSGQQNAMIGAGLGSLLLGPLGGIFGGMLGGLFGPENSHEGFGFRFQSAGWGSDAAPTNDMASSLLPVSRQYYNRSGDQYFRQADAIVKATNEYLAANGLLVGGAAVVSGTNDGIDNSWGGAGSLEQAYSRLRFSSTSNAELSASLSGRTFEGLDKLQEWVSGFTSAQDAIRDIANQSLPKFTQSLNSINESFDKAAATARKYGLSEAALTAERERQIAALEAARTETLTAASASLAARRLSAAGQTQQAELARQAESARVELRAFTEQLDDLAISAAEKSRLLVDLEEVQAAERAQIVQRYADQANQTLQNQLDQLRSAGQNIRSYLDSLNAGTFASPEDRVSSSRTAFMRDRDLAAAGNIDAANRVTNSADAYLQAARDYYASGSGFQTALNEVKTGLANIPAVQSVDQAMNEALQAIRQNLQLTGPQTLQVLNLVYDASSLSSQWLSNIFAAVNNQASNDVAHTSIIANAIGIVATNDAAHTGILANGLASLGSSLAVIAANDNAYSAATNTNIVAVGNAQVSASNANNTILATGFGSVVTSIGASNTLIASLNTAMVNQSNMQSIAFREMSDKLTQVIDKLDDIARSLSRLKVAA